MGRGAEGGVDVAVALSEDSGLGAEVSLVDTRLLGREQRYRQRFDSKLDQFGGILGGVGVAGEDHGDRLADITDGVLRQRRLAVWLKLFQPSQSKRYRRNVRDVRMRPHRMNAGQRQRRLRVDRPDPPVGDRRAHHAHMQLPRKRDVGGEAALPGEQRPIFQTRDGAADEFRPRRHLPRISFATARTALTMF